MTSEPDEHQGPVIRDKRRIDPETGKVREPRANAAPATPDLAADVAASDHADAVAAAETVGPSDVELALAERTADLQRLQAEYVNYKRRVDRDRQVTRDTAVASVLTSLLPVLDDIGRAREHDELTGGFKAVAESLERTVTALGLVTYGAAGDEFDPRIHEALMHTYSDDVEGPVCEVVLQVGYRLGERIVRPARVAVAEPAESTDPAPDPPEPADTTVDDGAAEAASSSPAEQADQPASGQSAGDPVDQPEVMAPGTSRDRSDS